MKNFPAPPSLNTFVDYDSIIGGRGEKKLPNSAYKLAGPGSPYGFDTTVQDFGVDLDLMALTFPAADGNRRDGTGDLMEIGNGYDPTFGIDASRHILNPCILFDHGKSVTLPIAMSEGRESKTYSVNYDPVAKVATVTAYFYQGRKAEQESNFKNLDKSQEYDHALFCAQLFDMARQRLLKSGSIGYQIKRAEEIPADYQKGIPKGLHLLSTLALEFSLVVLPCNADTTISKSLGYSPYQEWQEGIAQVLSKNQLCGKSLSPVLVKSLSPYAPPKIAQLGYEGSKSMAVPNETKAMSSLNENTGGALVPPPANGPPIEKKNKQKSLRKKYKGNYGIEGVHQPGYEAQREKEGVVTVPNSKWKPGRGAIKSLDEQEETAKKEAQKSHLPHVKSGMYVCNNCGKKYYTEAKAKSCHGTEPMLLRGKKSHAFVGTSNAGITGNGLGGDLLKEVEKYDPYVTPVKPGNQKSQKMTEHSFWNAVKREMGGAGKGADPKQVEHYRQMDFTPKDAADAEMRRLGLKSLGGKTGKKYGDSLPQDAPDEVWAHNSYDQRFKNLRKKYKSVKGIAGAVAGGVAGGAIGGPAGALEGASAGSTVQDAFSSKDKSKGMGGDEFVTMLLSSQSNAPKIREQAKQAQEMGLSVSKLSEAKFEISGLRSEVSKFAQKIGISDSQLRHFLKGLKDSKKSAPGITEEPNHKSISVKWRNKVVKGFAEVQLRFDMMDIDIDKQNAFLVEMAKEGFGTPGQGRYVSKEPPKLAAPLKQATFTFTIEPMNRQSEDDAVSSAIRTATQIAKRHGCRYTGNIGKSLGLNYNTKALEESNMPEEMEEEQKDLEGGEGEEKYSAQVLRHMHENALILLEEYDSFVEQLEHPEIAKHLHSKLEALVGELDEIEGMMDEHHPEAEALGEKDMDGASEEGDSEETPVEADSEEEEVPDPDEVLEGMDTKSLRNHYIKSARKFYGKSSYDPKKDPYRKPGRGLGIEDGHKPELEEFDNSGLEKGPKLGSTKKSVDKGRGLGVEGGHMPGSEEHDNSGLRKGPGLATTKKCAACGSKDVEGEGLGVEGEHLPGKEEHDNSGVDVGRGLAPTTKGLKSHHMKTLEGAKAHLQDASNEYNWDHEHRMKSYHWHKALEETGDDAFGGMDEKDFPVVDNVDSEMNVTEPGEMGEKDYQEMPNDTEMNPIQHEMDNDFQGAKSLHPHHKCMMGASKFLKDLSDTFDYTDDHRQEAASHHMNLDGLTKNFEEMDGVDGESEVQEPGEKSVKALEETVIRNAKMIAELKKLTSKRK